jgi:hypothetical protein
MLIDFRFDFIFIYSNKRLFNHFQIWAAKAQGYNNILKTGGLNPATATGEGKLQKKIQMLLKMLFQINRGNGGGGHLVTVSPHWLTNQQTVDEFVMY